ncbi:MAG: DNA/RNA non-specific endonuclease [Rikenellaceae bacterium]|nr:DNA/RNA non-specific endonuclease [Rikenellaceae bacterium]
MQIKIICIQVAVLYFLLFEAGCSVSTVIKNTDDADTVFNFHGQGLELPAIADSTFLLYNHTGRYTVYYDTMHRQAAWVAYVLTSGDVRKKDAVRKKRFVPDSVIVRKGWPYAVTNDYSGSGYDRGHLLPSADRTGSQNENNATFYRSNISPQHPDLNRKIWNKLEQDIRKLALKYDTLYIVTGPELKNDLKKIGINGVGVPENFFKVLLVKSAGRYYSVGFVIPNREKIHGSYWDYSMSVREAEWLLGYDFFNNLPLDLQEQAETAISMDIWRP